VRKYFEGTEHETDTCPRRLLMQNADVGHALALWRSCDGKVGAEGRARYTAQAFEALSTIDDAMRMRAKEDAESGS